MATQQTSGPTKIAILRIAATCDIVLGVLIAIVGPGLVPLEDIAPGVKLLWLVGGLLVIGGVAVFGLTLLLQQRERAAAAQADDAPVRRE